MAPRLDSEILALLANNTSGAISPQDVREAFETARAPNWIDVRAFGALGNDGNDTTALQNAIDAAVPAGTGLFFPAGTYRVTAPLTIPEGFLRIVGASPYGTAKARLIGDFNGPLMRCAGTGVHWVYNSGNQLWERPTSPVSSLGCRVDISHMEFYQEHIDGSCAQFYNLWELSSFRHCVFGSDMGGLFLLQSFNTVVDNCSFASAHFTGAGRTIESGHWRQAYGLWVNGHATLSEISAFGWGIGLHLEGLEIKAQGRIEVCGGGIVLGSKSGEPQGTLAPDIAGDARSLTNADLLFAMESSWENFWARNTGLGVSARLAISGGTNGPKESGATRGDFGVKVEPGMAPIYMPGLIVSVDANFETGAIVDAQFGRGLIDFGYGNIALKVSASAAQTLSRANYRTGTHIVHTGAAVNYTLPARVFAVEPDVIEEITVHNRGSGAITWVASGVTLHPTSPGTLAAGSTAILTWENDGSVARCWIK